MSAVPASQDSGIQVNRNCILRNVAGKLWNVLPPDVLRSILGKLPFRDAWTCRSLSSCWASAFRASIPVELVIPAKRRNLRAKLRRLQRTALQSSNTLPDQRSYTLKLTELTSVADCGSLLRSLTKEGKVEAPCQVWIQLQAPKAASLPTLNQTVAKIVAAIAQLASNNITVCIGLDAGKTGALPRPSFLNTLAPILNQLDCLTSLRLSNPHSCALLPSTSQISFLSVCRHRLNAAGYHQHNFSLELLASFTNLRQLELHLDTCEGLTHLSTLKGLLEFHLTVRRHGWSDSNCGHILKSNRDSLLHVSLTAESWDDRTYWALPHLSKLRTFSLRVEQLGHGNALVLAQLRPSQSMSVIINKTDLVFRMIMQEVTSFDAHITDLTLNEVCPFARTIHLQTMQHLTSLTLVGLDPTRTDFQPQPSLQMLKLDGVCMGSTHFEQMVQNYPSLKQLSLQRLQMSPDSLSTVLLLRRLSTLYLRDVKGMSAARLRWRLSSGRNKALAWLSPKSMSHARWLIKQSSFVLTV